jgi:4-amino-4-deoxy-L-arabinose transferase-like glycosyltransferase
MTQPTGTSSSAKLSLPIAAFIVLAAALRIFNISHESFWLDEVASWSFATRDLAGVLHSEPTNPPLYYLLLHYWIGWFGTSEAAIRALSVVPGVLTTWIIYRFSTKLFNRNAAILAAGLQAIGTFQIFYSQEARCFAWLGAMILAAGLCLWNALAPGEFRQQLPWYLAYIALSVAACYMHFIAVFFIAGAGLYVLGRKRSQWLKAGASFALCGALFLPWLLAMVAAAGAAHQIRRFLFLKFPQAYFSFLFGDSLIPLDEYAVQHIRQTLVANWWILAIGLALVLVLAWNGVAALRKWGEPLIYAAAMCTLPVLLAWGVSFKVALFDERYLFPASLFLTMTLSAIVEDMRSRLIAGHNRKAVWWLAPVAAGWGLLLALSLVHYYFNPRFGKEQWRDAADYVEANTTVPGSTALVFEPDYVNLCFRYYEQQYPREFPKISAVPMEKWDQPKIQADAQRGLRYIWLVRSHEENADSLDGLRAMFPLVREREFPKQNGIVVYQFATSR